MKYYKIFQSYKEFALLELDVERETEKSVFCKGKRALIGDGTYFYLPRTGRLPKEGLFTSLPEARYEYILRVEKRLDYLQRDVERMETSLKEAKALREDQV